MSKTFQCSFDIALHMHKIGFPQLESLGRQRRAKYIREQLKLQKMQLADNIDEPLPPCVNCPPGVFLFCQQTASECAIFNLYVGYHKQADQHRCFLKFETSKAMNPEFAKYCTEDSQVIKRQESRRKVYQKKEKPCAK